MLLSPVQFLLFASFLLENFNFRQITWKSRKYQKHHLPVILSLKSSCFFGENRYTHHFKHMFLHIFCWVVTYVDLHHLPSVSFFHIVFAGRVHHSPPWAPMAAVGFLRPGCASWTTSCAATHHCPSAAWRRRAWAVSARPSGCWSSLVQRCGFLELENTFDFIWFNMDFIWFFGISLILWFHKWRIRFSWENHWKCI